MRQLLDFIYPSFCIFCKSKASINDVFCDACTKYLVLEMDDTVMHVLEENPISVAYLKFIRERFPKKHIQTLAAFTVVKYFRIFKNTPICIFSSKNKLAHAVGKYTAKLIKKPFKKNMSGFLKKDLEKEEIVFFCLNNNDIKELKII